MCNVDGVCIDAVNDEIFKFTIEDGKFVVKREVFDMEVFEFEGVM